MTHEIAEVRIDWRRTDPVGEFCSWLYAATVNGILKFPHRKVDVIAEVKLELLVQRADTAAALAWIDRNADRVLQMYDEGASISELASIAVCMTEDPQ